MSKRTPPRARTEHDAWPVVVRVLVPEHGLASLYTLENDIWDWLHRSLGRGEYFQGVHQCSLGDGVAFHFRAVEDAAAFLERFPKLVLADDTMAVH